MLSILNIQNMLLVVCLTFIVNKFTDRLSGKKALLLGLVLFGVGYVTVTSANTWYVLIIFNFIANVGELVYSPIRNAEQANMIPADKRGSYSAFAGLSDIGWCGSNCKNDYYRRCILNSYDDVCLYWYDCNNRCIFPI